MHWTRRILHHSRMEMFAMDNDEEEIGSAADVPKKELDELGNPLIHLSIRGLALAVSAVEQLFRFGLKGSEQDSADLENLANRLDSLCDCCRTGEFKEPTKPRSYL